jgi:hypothetical protein
MTNTLWSHLGPFGEAAWAQLEKKKAHLAVTGLSKDAPTPSDALFELIRRGMDAGHEPIRFAMLHAPELLPVLVRTTSREIYPGLRKWWKEDWAFADEEEAHGCILHEAVNASVDPEWFSYFVRLNPIDDVDPSLGTTVLHSLCTAPHPTVLHLDALLSLGKGVLDLNARDNEGLTPLMAAAKNPAAHALIPALIHRGADPNLLHDSELPTVLAMVEGTPEEMRSASSLLVSHGARWPASNSHAISLAFIPACFDGEAGEVRQWLQEMRGAGMDIHQHCALRTWDPTPLHTACRSALKGRTDAFIRLLEAGADPAFVPAGMLSIEEMAESLGGPAGLTLIGRLCLEHRLQGAPEGKSRSIYRL